MSMGLTTIRSIKIICFRLLLFLFPLDTRKKGRERKREREREQVRENERAREIRRERTHMKQIDIQ